MKRIGFSIRLTKKYALDVYLFYPFRSLKDGLSAFEFSIDWSWYKGDHQPSFKIFSALCNFVLIDFTIYNVHHI